MHTILVVLGIIVAIPVVLVVIFVGGLLTAQARGKNPFQ
jgi:hypothetical protein